MLAALPFAGFIKSASARLGRRGYVGWKAESKPVNLNEDWMANVEPAPSVYADYHPPGRCYGNVLLTYRHQFCDRNIKQLLKDREYAKAGQIQEERRVLEYNIREWASQLAKYGVRLEHRLPGIKDSNDPLGDVGMLSWESNQLHATEDVWHMIGFTEKPGGSRFVTIDINAR